MSHLYWKNADPPDTDDTHEPARGVNEQHPLPVSLFSSSDGVNYEETGENSPLPVQVAGSVTVQPGYVFKSVLVPGITVADAFDAGDQMGSAASFTGVPPSGTIQEMFFLDRDDEGIDKTVWLFSSPPALAASDAAFTLTDEDLFNLVGVFTFTVWRDAGNNQVGVTGNTPCAYVMSGTTLYAAVQTSGADNIATNNSPLISIVIEEAR
jgi:hypothetical protein